MQYALPMAAGVGLSALENRYLLPDLDPGLKGVNLGIGALTGAGMMNPATRGVSMTSLPFKQLGLFGISSMDKLRQQQQALVDANLQVADIQRQTAELNKSDAAHRGRNMLLFLLPALAAGGGLGYLGWSQYKKKKEKIPRYGTVAEKGKRPGGEKIRIDVPARALPPEFFKSLTNADDSPNAYTRLLRLDDEDKEANAWLLKHASTDHTSLPGLLGNIAYEFTGIPGTVRTMKDVGRGGAAFMGDDFSEAGRYGASAAGNALLTLLTLRTATMPMLGKLLGQRYLERQMGMLGGKLAPTALQRHVTGIPGVARTIHNWSYGPGYAGAAGHTYDPTRYAWQGATSRSPIFKRLFTAPPATPPTFLHRGFRGTIPSHIFNVGRYGANRAINAGYWAKQLARRHPIISALAIGTPAAMVGSELDERRTAENAERMKGLMPDWDSRRGPLGIPVSSAFAGLMKSLGGTDIQSPLKQQIRGGSFDPWASMRPQ